MTTISKFIASLVTISPEATFALANLNFDFSLIRVDASPEFHGLGAALTAQRRDAAEGGLAHITARKLSALFQQMIPPIPTLIKVYGTRVSNISAMTGVNPHGTKADGFLADHVGADGTTIWAAATSGGGAIAMHLLACMLARIWTGPQAVAIWVELVAERKKELAAMQMDDSVGILATVAQIDLSREQLSAWDASARAWLESADKAKTLQHLQMKLIVDNLSIPVNTREKVYTGVTRAWKAALATTEALLTGQPQRVQDGAILLGLISWHIYPDLLVLGKDPVEVQQNDDLVPKQGILTVGLSGREGVDRSNDGVFWSLPLAHLQFYGDPIETLRSVGTDAARISFDDFLQVVLGAAVSRWMKYTDGVSQAAELLLSVQRTLDDAPSSSPTIPRWFIILRDAAAEYSSSKDAVRRSYDRLIALGNRRNNTLLSPTHPTALLGLGTYSTLFGLMDSEKECISALRIIAAKLPYKEEDIIIRYKVLWKGRKATTQHHWEYATAQPELRKSMKRSRHGTGHQASAHCRWILDTNTVCINKKEQNDTEGCRGTCQDICSEGCSCRATGKECSVKCHKKAFAKEGHGYNCTNLERKSKARDLEIDLAERASIVRRQGEVCFEYGFDDIYEDVAANQSTSTPEFHWTRARCGEDGMSLLTETIKYRFLSGDPSVAAIFCREDRIVPDGRIPGSDLELADLTAIFDARLVHHHLLSAYLSIFNGMDRKNPKNGGPKSPVDYPEDDDGRDETSKYFEAIYAVVAARDLYRLLKGATIDIGVTLKRVAQASWFPGSTKYSQLGWLTRTQAFACIAFFESGGLDLVPDNLTKVICLSSGSSLYVAEALLRDPWIRANQGQIRRLTGNIGRAGLTLMVPPANPRVCKFDPESWQLINHSKFDGKLVDAFHSTSLHLSFTEYELPVDTGIHGGRDHAAYFLESLVSVYNGKDWIADLDVLAMFENKHLHRLPRCPFADYDCKESYIKKPGAPEYRDHKSQDIAALRSSGPLTVIENWHEFMDPPTHLSIVMAHGNWYARLAAVAINVQRRHSTCLLSPGSTACWACFQEWRQSRKDGTRDIVIA
ncbi:hypothetical protein ACEPPN_018900 [Leptodophora sp. 'Broadleaf-Isolate-01']